MATADAEPRRVEAIRHRVALAKAALALAATAVFGGAVALSKLHNAGHPKQPLRPLWVLPGYRAAVRKDVGSTGVIDPPLASPSAATHVS